MSIAFPKGSGSGTLSVPEQTEAGPFQNWLGAAGRSAEVPNGSSLSAAAAEPASNVKASNAGRSRRPGSKTGEE
jgi:hypothetical protein